MFDRIKRFYKSMPVDWLLTGESFVKYRTLTDLLAQPEDDKEIIATRK
jgi:hypothetical protein